MVSELFVDRWGAGTPVVLVHGSLATGIDEWEAQAMRHLLQLFVRMCARKIFLVPVRGYAKGCSTEQRRI